MGYKTNDQVHENGHVTVRFIMYWVPRGVRPAYCIVGVFEMLNNCPPAARQQIKSVPNNRHKLIIFYGSLDI